MAAILDQDIGKTVKGYCSLYDRVLLLKIARKPLDLNIIQVCAPTATSSDEDKENVYEGLEHAKEQCRQRDPFIIMGDFRRRERRKKW